MLPKNRNRGQRRLRTGIDGLILDAGATPERTRPHGVGRSGVDPDVGVVVLVRNQQ
jgi:hypothetical protein